jgi:peptidoglycan hydrolase-like protein with peptidoglycan-binding domain
MTLQISATQLSFGTQGDDVARVQQALQALGRDLPLAERGVMGAGTVAVLKALQADFGLPATGIVDTVTVKAINVRLAKLATDPRIVRGSVLGANPSSTDSVRLFSQGPNGEQAIGKSVISAVDGRTRFPISPCPMAMATSICAWRS